MINEKIPLPNKPQCCQRKNRNHCDELTLFVDNSKKKRAFVTLLMMGDEFLPGVILLGYKLQCICSEIDRVCMVTYDVSSQARENISMIYTHIVEVPYISSKSKHVSKSQNTRSVKYINSFTKLHAINLVNYDIVAFIDADTLPLRKMENIFDVHTPAALYWGCAHPWTSERQQRHYLTRMCGKFSHGTKIDWEFQEQERKTCKTKDRMYYGMETSVFVVQPNEDEFNKIIRLMRNVERAGKQMFLLKGDSTLLGYFWAKKLCMLDMRYLVRNAQQHSQVRQAYMLDMFGPVTKPWQADTIGDHIWCYTLWKREFLKMSDHRPDLLSHPSLKSLALSWKPQRKKCDKTNKNRSLSKLFKVSPSDKKKIRTKHISHN